MQRHILTLAYKGTNYHGWQIQPNALTIQQELKNALETALRHKVCIYGAGRTDTGVHASFYVAHFDTEAEITDLNKLVRSLNGILPRDIVVFDILPANSEFNSRFSAIERTYKYFISFDKSVFLDDFTMHLHYFPDIEKMNRAATLLLDYQDFKSFEKYHSDSKTSICNVRQAFWEMKDNLLIFNIKADRFLRNMVRSIVGTLLNVGKGKIGIEEFRAIIELKDRKAAGASVSAKGLFLTDISYPAEIDSLLEKSRQKSKITFQLP